jgi:hypothetical protein
MFRTFIPAEPKRTRDEMDACDAPDITIVTGDRVKYCLPRNIAMQIGLLQIFMSDSDSDSDDEKDQTKFPLPNVDSKEFDKVVEYLVLHANSPASEIAKPIIGKNINAVVNYIDREFINNLPLNGDTNVFDVMKAGDYLQIPTLVDLCSAKIAINVQGKTLDQVRADFGIQDPTDEFYEPTQEELNLIAGRDAKDNGGGGGGESKNND